MNAKTKLRLHAVFWTAAVASIPAASFFLYVNYIYPGYNYPALSVLLLTSLPVIAAGMSGCLWGWRLLEPIEHRNAVPIILLGLRTALLAYAVLGGMIMLCLSPVLFMGEGVARLIREPMTIVLMFLFAYIVTVGVIIVLTGWFTLPVAGIAGYLLNRRYRHRRSRAMSSR